MADWLFNHLDTFSGNPLGAAIFIILVSFILEDAATIGAGLLAVAGVIEPQVALAALYIGIVVGDIGLYAIGRLAHLIKWPSYFISKRSIVTGRRWLRRRFVVALIGARFTPGLRTPTFLASGFLRLSFPIFCITVVLVAGVWTSLLFWLIFTFGELTTRLVGDAAWIFGVTLLALVIVGPTIWRRVQTKPPRLDKGSQNH